MVSLILNILLLLLLILYMYRIALLLTNLRQRKSGCNDADERSFFSKRGIYDLYDDILMILKLLNI